MGKDTRPGDRQGWVITDPDLAQRMEAHRKERKAIRRRQTAARITALVAAFLLGLAVGRYTRPPAQADEPEPPPATSTPAATVPATFGAMTGAGSTPRFWTTPTWNRKHSGPSSTFAARIPTCSAPQWRLPTTKAASPRTS